MKSKFFKKSPNRSVDGSLVLITCKISLIGKILKISGVYGAIDIGYVILLKQLITHI